MKLMHWFDKLRNGDDYTYISKLIRYGDPLFIFVETVLSRMKRKDKLIIGDLSEDDLNNTSFWKTIICYRTLTLHSAVFTTQIEIEQAASNLYTILRLFGVSLESKTEFNQILENKEPLLIFYSDEGWVNLDVNSLKTKNATEIRDEYNRIRVGTDKTSRQLRILLRFLGFLIHKCVGHRDRAWGTISRQFKTFDVSTPCDTLPELIHIERIIM